MGATELPDTVALRTIAHTIRHINVDQSRTSGGPSPSMNTSGSLCTGHGRSAQVGFIDLRPGATSRVDTLVADQRSGRRIGRAQAQRDIFREELAERCRAHRRLWAIDFRSALPRREPAGQARVSCIAAANLDTQRSRLYERAARSTTSTSIDEPCPTV